MLGLVHPQSAKKSISSLVLLRLRTLSRYHITDSTSIANQDAGMFAPDICLQSMPRSVSRRWDSRISSDTNIHRRGTGEVVPFRRPVRGMEMLTIFFFHEHRATSLSVPSRSLRRRRSRTALSRNGLGCAPTTTFGSFPSPRYLEPQTTPRGTSSTEHNH